MLIDLRGKRFGRLTALEHQGASFWKCICDCGNEKIVESWQLRNGYYKSCGCLRDEIAKRGFNRKHGESSGGKTSGEYDRWRSMKQRCYDPKCKSYPAYGARGIKVCDRWLNDYSTFLADMGRCPKGFVIDRIDVNGNYEPGNCQWTTVDKSLWNRRERGIMVTIGDKTMCLKDWAKELGVGQSAIYSRYRSGKFPGKNNIWAGPDEMWRNRPGFNVEVTVGGETMCLKDWARKLGLKYATLYARYKRGKWPN